MTLSKSSKSFIAAGQVHLTVWGVLWTLNVLVVGHLVTWDTLLWLFVIGFVGFTILGFSLHLFPFLSGKPLHVKPPQWPTFVLGEAAVVLGSIGLSGWTWAWILGATCWLLTGGLTVSTFLFDVGRRAKARPIESETILLFAASWVFGLLAAVLWAATAWVPGLMDSPGLGLWVVGLHFYLLGQVTLLIFGVSIKMIPKAQSVTPPQVLTKAIPYLAISGAALIPAAMTMPLGLGLGAVALAAIPEGVAAILFLSCIVFLIVRAKTPKPAVFLYLVSALALLAAGSMGASIARDAAFSLVNAHALLALFGFVTIMIVGMSFSMLAPFQFVAHRVTLLVMRLELAFFASVTAVAVIAYDYHALPPMDAGLAVGVLVTAGATLLLLGSLPVIYYDWWNAWRSRTHR